MKATIRVLASMALLAAAPLNITSCSSTPPPAVGSAEVTYKKGVLGGVLVQTFKLTTTVAAIDPLNRTARLQGAGGKQFAVKVGRDVANLDLVGVGDQIVVTLTQKAIVSPVKNAAASQDAGAPADDTIQTIGTAVAIDPAEHTVTLQFEDGSTETYTRTDVDLSRHKLGEQFIFRVTEMTVIWIEKP